MSPGFMQWWTPRAARIDAISLRERILLFVTTLACVGALANWAWLAPAQDAHRRLLDNLDRQGMELQKARADLAAVARPVATQAAVRGELAEVDARLASGRETLRGLSSPAATQGTPTTPLTQLLVHLLHRHDGLTLLHTNTMNAAASPAAARAGPVGRGEGTRREGGTRHGTQHLASARVEGHEVALAAGEQALGIGLEPGIKAQVQVIR